MFIAWTDYALQKIDDWIEDEKPNNTHRPTTKWSQMAVKWRNVFIVWLDQKEWNVIHSVFVKTYYLDLYFFLTTEHIITRLKVQIFALE